MSEAPKRPRCWGSEPDAKEQEFNSCSVCFHKVSCLSCSRPSRIETMLRIAEVIAERSTCCRRRVGCVLTDKNGRVLSIGHNGVAMGQPHCTDEPCRGAHLPSGTGLDRCLALHAEQNALMFCSDIMKIDTCHVTASPCMTCVKLLLNTSCRTIVFRELYPHTEALKLWTDSGRSWVHHGKTTKV